MAQVGILGLGLMGRNLAIQLAARGFPLAAYSYLPAETASFRELPAAATVAIGRDLADFVRGLQRPRTLLLMITAGELVDAVIADLAPLLDPGDCIIDGGNTHFRDTVRRQADLAERAIALLGVGISGGAEGARTGASIMVGGDAAVFERHRQLFNAIAAEHQGRKCYGYFGQGGAGHFIKMVHNGIEYGLMQLIAECCRLMNDTLGWSRQQQRELIERMASGRLASYLLEITAEILTFPDAHDGTFLLDRIADAAGHKGTGTWTVDAAMALGVPTPTINAAVTERLLSTLVAQRRSAARPAPAQRPAQPPADEAWGEIIEQALYCALTATYAQGFALLQAAIRAHGWVARLADIAAVWQGGCIIRAALLAEIEQALRLDGAAANLLAVPSFRARLVAAEAGWRRFVIATVEGRVTAPAMTASLGYWDSYCSASLPTNLIQAQRDYFGAHGYRRTDQPGDFHTIWKPL